MRNTQLIFCLLISCLLSNNSGVFAQATPCPSLTATGGTTSCTSSCATITATPSVNLHATTSYSLSSVTYSPDSYTAGTGATFSGAAWSGSTDDYYSGVIALPFTFCFFGTSHTSIIIGTNGNICFNTALAGGSDPYSISGPLPGSNNNATYNSIMGVWNDTYAGGTGSIKYATYGTAPCRRFVVSWSNCELFLPGSFCDGNTTTSQITLYETTNIIDIYIGHRTPCTSWNSGYAVTGIENAAGTTYYCPPGENGTTFTATNEGWRFTPAGAASPWTYHWTGPGTTAADTTASISVCPTTTTTYTCTASSTACTGVTLTATAVVTSTGGGISAITGGTACCIGATVPLADATPGGTWTSSDNTIATVSSTGVVTGIAAGTVTITYTSGGCSSTLSFTVYAQPAAPTAASPTYCQFAPASALTATGVGLTWYGPGVTAGYAAAPTPSTASTGTTTYYVTQTNAGGCVSDSTMIVVTVNPKPTPPVPHTDVYCQNAIASPVSATGTSLTWYGPGVTLGMTTAPTPSTTTAGTVTYYVTQTSTLGCRSDSATDVVTINTRPTPPTPTSVAYCRGAIATPISATGTSLTWYGPGVTGPMTTAPTPSTATVGVQNFYVTQTSALGCISDSALLTVTINAIPLAPTVTPVTYCQLAVASPLTATGTSLVWYGPGTTAGTTVAPTPSTATATTLNYYVTQTSAAGCTSDSGHIIVTINPRPALPTTTPYTYCQFATATPVTATGTTLHWYGPGVTGAMTTAPTPNTTVAGVQNFYVTQTTAAGCVGDSALEVITVNPKPAAPTPVPNTYCVNAVATPVSAIGSNLVWYGPGFTAAMSTAPTPSTATAGTINYFVTQTSAAGCVSDSAIDVVTIAPIPAAPIPHNDTYCQFAIAFPITASGTTLTWYGPGFTVGSSSAPTPSTAIPGSFTYYVTQTSSFGCVSDSALDVVTVIPKPLAPTTTDSAYCQNYVGAAPVSVQVTGATGATFNYYTSGGSPIAVAPTPNTTIPDFPYGTTYFVSQTVNGCESDRSPIVVTIMPIPSFALNYVTSLCQGTPDNMSFTLSPGSVLSGATYTWVIPEFSHLSGGSTSSPSVTLMIDSTTNRYNVGTLTIGNFGGQCASTDTFTIEIAPLPAATAFIKQEICKGDTVGLTLTSRTYNALHFFWYVDEVPLASSSVVNTVTAYIDDQGPYSISFNDTGLHVIKLLCNTALGCMSSPFYDTVRVHQAPDATFQVSPLSNGALCIEDSMLFRANAVDPTFSYLWQPTHYFSNDNRYNIYGKVEQAKSAVTLTVTDPFGCKTSNTEEIDPATCCTVSFPTAFTPNNDGKNDFFHPIFAGFHRFHQFRVVNRWGETVFASSDSDPKWDGYFNGVPQDMGVYYYYIKYDCGGTTREQKGECTLVR